MNSPLQRIEQITRQEALNHVNAAWIAQRRLMRKCLGLKLKLPSSSHHQQQTEESERIDVTNASASSDNPNYRDTECGGTTCDAKEVDESNQLSVGQATGEQTHLMQTNSNIDDAHHHQDIIYSQSMDVVSTRNDNKQQINNPKEISSSKDHDTSTIIQHSQSLDSNNERILQGGRNSKNNKRKRGVQPSVADLSTRNMIVQHFTKLQKKK
eukprot:scaffold68079_cov66-Cyclotella_meneghiniana.AAC.8